MVLYIAHAYASTTWYGVVVVANVWPFVDKSKTPPIKGIFYGQLLHFGPTSTLGLGSLAQCAQTPELSDVEKMSGVSEEEMAFGIL